MLTPLPLALWTGLVVSTLPGAPFAPAGREAIIVDTASEVLTELAAIPFKEIPPALLCDAQGVMIIPAVIKAGFVIGGRHGRGVILVRQPDGSWGNPIFVTFSGGSIGWQAGLQSTDLVLVFKTRASLDRILQGKGKLTLGADVAVAAGPIGRQAEAGTDAQLKAEIYSYSRSRGLFAGVSLEGAALLIDQGGNEAFYRLQSVRPADVMALQGPQVPPGAERLKATLTRLSCPPAAPATLQPPQLVPLPPSTSPPPLVPTPTPPPDPRWAPVPPQTPPPPPAPPR